MIMVSTNILGSTMFSLLFETGVMMLKIHHKQTLRFKIYSKKTVILNCIRM